MLILNVALLNGRLWNVPLTIFEAFTLIIPYMLNYLAILALI